MLEKSPTLGSIETSEAVKRRFALATHEFNLQNKVYQELFPGADIFIEYYGMSYLKE